jgi:hypothetical protein|tara:strand:+ start:50 stop:406 length:357 start_codon:yes stop_codon:yes gene_type:complete
MITYNWNCRTVDARPLENGETNVVYDVHWMVIGTSDEVDAEGNPYLATVIGVQNVPWNPEGTFIPFEDLTNEIVVEWTKSAMGEEQVAGIEANIQSQINALITPTSVTLLIGAEMLDE